MSVEWEYRYFRDRSTENFMPLLEEDDGAGVYLLMPPLLEEDDGGVVAVAPLSK